MGLSVGEQTTTVDNTGYGQPIVESGASEQPVDNQVGAQGTQFIDEMGNVVVSTNPQLTRAKSNRTTLEGMQEVLGGGTLSAGSLTEGRAVYQTQRALAQQIMTRAAATATAETLGIAAELDYGRGLLTRLAEAQEQIGAAIEAGREPDLSQLDALVSELPSLGEHLGQLDELIARMETELHEAEALLATPPGAEDGRERAEAMARLSDFNGQYQGHVVETGSLAERLARAKDARTTLRLVQASLRLSENPANSDDVLLGSLVGEGGELNRLNALLSQLAPDDPRSADLEAVRSMIMGTVEQIQGRWDNALNTLRSIEQSFDLSPTEGRGSEALERSLNRLEQTLGIQPPQPAEGTTPAEAIQHRVGALMQAQRQQGAMIVSFLQSDVGMDEQQLIEMGMLRGPPGDVVRNLKAQNPELAEQFGLTGADPDNLTPAEQQIATMLAIQNDPQALRSAMMALYSEWRIDPSTRQLSADLIDLGKMAQTGRFEVDDTASLPGLRQQTMAGRQFVSADELSSLYAYTGTHRGDSLEDIASDNGVPRDIRLIADKLLHNEAAAAHLNPRGHINRTRLRNLASRVAGFEYPGEAAQQFNGKMLLDNFYDPTALDRDVEALYRSMKGIMYTDEDRIFTTLGHLSPAQRQMVAVEFSRRMRTEGYDGEDGDAQALYSWLRDELSGWEYGKAMSLMQQRRTGDDWGQHLRDHPGSLIDSIRGQQGGDLSEVERRAEIDKLRSPEGRLEWQRDYFNIFRDPYNTGDMGDEQGLADWRERDEVAAAALGRYESAVAALASHNAAIRGDPDAHAERRTQLEAAVDLAEVEFTNAAGDAIAEHRLLTNTYSTQLDERIRTQDMVEQGLVMGAVVVAATAASIYTAGLLAGPGWAAVGATAAGFAAGAAAGTAVGFGLEVGLEYGRRGSWEAVDWSAIGTKTYGHAKMAAGAAFPGALATTSWRALAGAAWFAGSSATIGQAAVQSANVAHKISIGARVANVGKNMAAGAVINTAGSFGMRGVHSIADWATGTETPVTPDLEFSWKNLFIEMGSGAVGGAFNPFLASLGQLDEGAGVLRQIAAKGSGFSFDMTMNLADEASRNLVYGRDVTEGLTHALLMGAPANVAGGMAGRRAALTAQNRAIRARQVLADPTELGNFLQFAGADDALRAQLLNADGTLNRHANMGDFEIAIGKWEQVQSGNGQDSAALGFGTRDTSPTTRADADDVTTTRTDSDVASRVDRQTVALRTRQLQEAGADLPPNIRREFGLEVANFSRTEAELGVIKGDLQTLTRRLEQIGSNVDPMLRTEIEGHLQRLQEKLGELDASRGRLQEVVGDHMPGEARRELRYATANQQDAAVSTLLTEFYGSAGFAQRLAGTGVMADGVSGLSPRATAALAQLLSSKYSSVDPTGAANVQHLSTVLDGVLTYVAEGRGRPLTQAEVDELVLTTVLTDAQGKGRVPDDLADMPIAPTRIGDEEFTTFGPLWAKMKEVNPALDSPRMGFMAGTLAHGIPDFDSVAAVVRRTYGPPSAEGSPNTAQRVYESVLGHHMAGFVADGFAASGMMPNFQRMAEMGNLTPEQATRLQNLYEAAVPLAGQFRGEIDGVWRRGDPAMRTRPDPDNPEIPTRQDYEAAASDLREAIAALPETVRAELLADDIQQFTAVGIPKWIGMTMGMHVAPDITNGKGANMGDLIQRTYERMAQPYYEENIARGVGDQFVAETLPVAHRLGMKLVEDGDTFGSHFAPAEPGELPYRMLAAGVENDLVLRTRFLEDNPGVEVDAAGRLRLDAEMEGRLVEWFRSQDPEPGTTFRLLNDDPPGFRNIDETINPRATQNAADHAARINEHVNRLPADAQGEARNLISVLTRAEADAGVARLELETLANRLAEAGPETTPQLRTEIEQRLANLQEKLGQAETVRGQLHALGFRHLSSDDLKAWTPSVAEGQMSAAHTFLGEFYSGGFAQRMGGAGILADGVSGVSPRMAAAMAELFFSPHSSKDMMGAANVQHLSTVLDGVLARAAREKGAPLTQAEVDDLAMTTVLTDAQAKGRSPEELRNMPIAPVEVDGEVFTTMGELWTKMQEVNPALQQPSMGFVAGTLAHGVPHFDSIANVVRQAYGDLGSGSPNRAQVMYESVIGHHMAGFVAAGFADAHMNVDFGRLVSAGHLTAEQGTRLRALYDAAIPLAGRYRKPIDAAGQRSDGPPSMRLVPDPNDPDAPTRAQYYEDAADLRAAIDGLTETVRAELLADDTQQFTTVGMPKWLGMAAGMYGPDDMGALVRGVYNRMVQPYYEENIARGIGNDFADESIPVASRLGMKFVPDGEVYGSHFAPAEPGELPHRMLAAGVANDSDLRSAFLEANADLRGPLSGDGPFQLSQVVETRLVNWFRGQAPNPGVASRLINVDPPGFDAPSRVGNNRRTQTADGADGTRPTSAATRVRPTAQQQEVLRDFVGVLRNAQAKLRGMGEDVEVRLPSVDGDGRVRGEFSAEDGAVNLFRGALPQEAGWGRFLSTYGEEVTHLANYVRAKENFGGVELHTLSRRQLDNIANIFDEVQAKTEIVRRGLGTDQDRAALAAFETRVIEMAETLSGPARQDFEAAVISMADVFPHASVMAQEALAGARARPDIRPELLAEYRQLYDVLDPQRFDDLAGPAAGRVDDLTDVWTTRRQAGGDVSTLVREAAEDPDLKWGDTYEDWGEVKDWFEDGPNDLGFLFKGLQAEQMFTPDAIPLLAELTRGVGTTDSPLQNITSPAELFNAVGELYRTNRNTKGNALAKSGQSFDDAGAVESFRVTPDDIRRTLGLGSDVDLGDVNTAMSVAGGADALVGFMGTRDFPLESAPQMRRVADALTNTREVNAVLADRVLAELQNLNPADSAQSLARIDEVVGRFEALSGSDYKGVKLTAAYDAVFDGPRSAADLATILNDPQLVAGLNGLPPPLSMAVLGSNLPVADLGPIMRMAKVMNRLPEIADTNLRQAILGGPAAVRELALSLVPADSHARLTAVSDADLFALLSNTQSRAALSNAALDAPSFLNTSSLPVQQRVSQLALANGLQRAGVDTDAVVAALNTPAHLLDLATQTLGGANSPAALKSLLETIFPGKRRPAELDVAALRVAWEPHGERIVDAMVQTLDRLAPAG